MNLFPFQQEGVTFLKKHNRSLLADDMGLGKTIQAIVAAKEQNLERILILCPCSVKYNWERELNTWWPEMKTQVVEGSKTNLWPFPRAIIMNYDIIHKQHIAKQLLGKPLDLLICDEAHFLKNPRAKRTKTVYMKKGLAYSSTRIWLLTGTPVLNRPVELFPALKALIPQKLGEYSDYMAFTRQYCAGYQSRWGWDVRGASNLDELAGHLDNFMLRREKKEVMSQLPDKLHQKIIYKPNKLVEKMVKKERKQFETQHQLLGDYAKARHELGVRKVPVILEHVENMIHEKEKIVIFAYHREVISKLQQALSKYGARVLYGGMPARIRQEHLNDFIEKDHIKFFIGQIDAAGTGIDGLQKVCDYALFAEISWVPGQLNQAIDRLHRIGQDKKVLIQFLLIKGSIDEDILDSVLQKTKTIKKLMKGGAYEKREVNQTKKQTTKEEEMYIEEKLDKIMVTLERIEELLGEKPKTPAKKTEKKPETKKKKSGLTVDTLLEYCNGKILAMEDKKAAKKIVQELVGYVKEEYEVEQIKELSDSKALENVKTKFNELYEEASAQEEEEEEDATL